MPTIRFDINESTGEMTVDINGVVGPKCDDIERLIEEVTGAPGRVETKPEYHQRVIRPVRTGR